MTKQANAGPGQVDDSPLTDSSRTDSSRTDSSRIDSSRTDSREPTIRLGSDQQQDWWAREHQHLNPDLVLCRHIDVDAPLEPDAFLEAVDNLIDRHEALRTSFVFSDGAVQQVIWPQADPGTAWIADFSDLPLPEARSQAEALVEAERLQVFRLDQPPLVRIGAIKVAADAFIVSIVLHHILADGWGLTVVVDDFEGLYGEACGRGEVSAAPAMQLSEWIEEERAFNASPEAAQELQYWQSKLEHTQPVRFPYDRPATPDVHFTFAVRQEVTAAGMRDAVDRRARKERATSSVVCMAALLKLLSVRLERPDVAAVTVFNRRGREDLRGLLACVTNAATIAVSLPEDAGARQWIRATRDSLLDAHANQRLFVSRVWDVADLGPGAVDVLFIYDGEWAPLTSFGGQPAHWHDYQAPRAYQRNGPWWENFKLRVGESGTALEITMEYNADLYEDATVEQLAAEYVSILTSFVEE
jgi:hypothetical protein